MVPQVLADTLEFVDRRDAKRAQKADLSDARKLEELRRVD